MGAEPPAPGRRPFAPALLEWLLSESSQSVVVLDREARILLWSDRLVVKRGEVEPTVVGRPFEEVLADVIFPDFQDRFRVALEGRTTRTEPRPVYVDAIGSELLLTIVTSPWHDGEGSVAGVFVMATSVTEPSRLEATLRRSEEKLHHVMATNPAIVYGARAEPPHAALFVSENVAGILGFPPEAFEAEPSIWPLRVHPDDLPRIASELASVTPEGKRYRYRFRHGDGRWRWLEDDVRLVPDGLRGEPFIIGCCRDVTSEIEARALAARSERLLVESQNRLRALFEDIAESVLFVNDAGEVIEANPAAHALLGTVEGRLRHFLDMFPESLKAAARERWCQVLEEGTGIGETRIVLSDGSLRTVRYRARADIAPHVHMVAARDITERRQAERREQARRRQQAALLALGRSALDAHGPDEVLAGGSRALADGLGASAAGCFELLDDGARLRLVAGCGWPDGAVGRAELAVPGDASVRELLARLVDPRSAAPLFVAVGARHAVSAVVELDGRAGYVLGAFSGGPRPYDDDASSFVESAAHIVSSAVLRERARARRTRLLEWIISSQDRERRWLARELHDTASQSMSAVLMGLRVIEASQSLDQAREGAARMRDLASETLGDLGRLARGIHPRALDDLGFCAAAERHLEVQASRFGFTSRFEQRGCEGERWPARVESELFRILQESLSNIARHAQARSVNVRVERRGDVASLEVADDGKGFDAERTLSRASTLEHFGLEGMRERAGLLGGTFLVESRRGEGTRLRVTIPLASGEGR